MTSVEAAEVFQIVDSIPVVGKFDIMHFDKYGNLLNSRKQKNLVVTAGKQYMAGLICGLQTGPFNMIQIGLSSEPATVEDTHLLSHYMEGAITPSVDGAKAIFECLLTIPAEVVTVTLAEAGVFKGTYGSSPSPVMLCRGTYPEFTATGEDKVLVRWRDTIG